MAKTTNKDPRTERPRGSGQRVVEQSHRQMQANRAPSGRVGRAGTMPGVQGRRVPHGAPGARVAADETANRQEAQRSAEDEQELARQHEAGETPGGTAPAGTGNRDVLEQDDEETRARNLPGIEADVRNRDTSKFAGNKSTRSQQPTNLESEGGTTQPHPTVSARAATTAMFDGPPGRSFDRGAAAARFLEQSGSSPEGTIMVRATAKGYYGDARRREGDVFALTPRRGKITEWLVYDDGEPVLEPSGLQRTREVDGILTAEEQFSPSWMEHVNADEAERYSTAQQAIDQEHDRIIGERGSANRRGAAGRAQDQEVV